MERENRYIVIKKNDMTVLTKHQHEVLDEIMIATNYHREHTGMKPLKCVVVESSWPEYEPTWGAIERRVSGADGIVSAIHEETLERPLGDCGFCLPPRKMLLAQISELENKYSDMLIVNSYLHEIMTELEDRGIHITSKKCWCSPTIEGCPDNDDGDKLYVRQKADALGVFGSASVNVNAEQKKAILSLVKFHLGDAEMLSVKRFMEILKVVLEVAG